MPRGDKILFKFKGSYNPDGTPAEFHSNIPARDILESDMGGLSDEHLVTLAASPLYTARNDGDEVAAKAERRVEKTAPPDAPTTPAATSVLPVESSAVSTKP